MMNYNSILLASAFLLFLNCQGAFANVGARISGVGAAEAAPGQFPWQVRLISYKNDGTTAYCSGVLVHKQFVLTAAQCITEQINVVQLNSTLSSSCSEHTLHVIGEKSFVHPNYTSAQGLVLNDIAMVRLAHPVPLSDTVKPVGLPIVVPYLANSTNATVAGWGQSPDPKNPTLMYADTKIITNEECKEYFYEENVVNGTLCTKSENSPCYGDGGSGLVQYVEGNPFVVGIVAFVPKDRCFNGGPAGYMRVPYYGDWIISVMKLYEA